MNPQQYLRTLWETWWLIVALVLIGIGAGLWYSYTQTPVYEASATFVVNPGARIAQVDDLLYSIDTLAGRTSLATTYSNILKSRTILEVAVTSLNLPLTILSEYKINSVVLPDSNVLLLQVQGPSAVLAADVANAIGSAGLEYISGLQEVYELRRLDTAIVDPVPVSPNHPTNIALSAAIGLMGALGFIILRQFLLQAESERQVPASGPIELMPGGTGLTEQVLLRNNRQPAEATKIVMRSEADGLEARQ